VRRVLFTSWYSGVGGGETDLLSLAESLDLSRYTPHLLLPREGKLGDKWQAMGFPVHYDQWRGASTFFIPAIWGRFPIVKRLQTLLVEQKIDLLHVDYHMLPMAVAASRAVNIPLMWTVHGWWFKPKFYQRDFMRRLPAVARSKHIRDGFLGNPPFMPADNLPVVYSGVDTDRFHPKQAQTNLRAELNIADDVPLVAMVARFQEVKGHDNFQQMAKLVLEKIPNAQFIVAGEDTFGVGKDVVYKERILQQAQSDAQLQAHLHYIGFRDDVERILATADVVVCPSDFESYGKVNLEAMACETPVVSTNQGGPAETVLDGETGYLVPIRNASALAERVIDLLQNDALRADMGRNGRAHILNIFSAQASADLYMQHFDSLFAK